MNNHTVKESHTNDPSSPKDGHAGYHVQVEQVSITFEYSIEYSRILNVNRQGKSVIVGTCVNVTPSARIIALDASLEVISHRHHSDSYVVYAASLKSAHENASCDSIEDENKNSVDVISPYL
eukprot:764905-Hanusia_phi.AAC.1